jgi:hypothetical protein
MTQDEVQELFSPAKTELIERGKNLLSDNGFEYMDYIPSLQGPTFIFTTEGRKKLTQNLSKSLREMGIKVL